MEWLGLARHFHRPKEVTPSAIWYSRSWLYPAGLLCGFSGLLNIRVDMSFSGSAGACDRTRVCVADKLRIFP